MNESLYDRDFYVWLREQAALLRERHFNALDFDNLIEEIGSLSRDQIHQTKHHIFQLLMLLLMQMYFPEPPQSLQEQLYLDIVEERIQIKIRVSISTTLQEKLAQFVEDQYPKSRNIVLQRLKGLGQENSDLPEKCPFSQKEIWS